MSTRIALTYCGMAGEGRTVTEAKKDAARRIEKAMEGSYSPIVLTAGEWQALMYRRPDCGWSHAIISGPDRERKEMQHLYGSPAGSQKDCEAQCRKHLGDLATDWRTCLTVDDVHPIVTDQSARRDILRSCEFTRRYRFAESLGFNDNQCHHLAGDFGHMLGLDQNDFEQKYANRQ